MKRIFLVRHGETDWNREGRFQGQMDIPMNRTGLGQARAVAETLKDVSLDRIVASPLARTRETARPLEELTGLPVEMNGGLVEISHGLWEGRTAGEVEAEWPGMLAAWHGHPELVTMPGGESLADVQKRAWPAFLRTVEEEGESVVVVSHDAVLKVILCRIFDSPLSSFWRFQLANGSITLLELGRNGWRVPLVGEAGHLGSVFRRVEQKAL